MIKVTFWQGAGGNLAGITVKGHAGFAPKGEDIICAAVSALAQTAVLSLKEQLAEAPEVIIEDGNLECFLPAGVSPASLEKAQVILKTIAVGLKAIADAHQGYIKVEYKIRFR